MAKVRTVKLELLRHGPQHNQLLSPLTPYLALCGPSGPQTVQIPFEHHQLLLRLARLRYDDSGLTISDAQREGELRDLGETIGGVLGGITGLQGPLSACQDGSNALIHLRLAVSALELGMVPFEAAIAPDNLPGSGAPLLLRTPIVITREVRRIDPPTVCWSRQPRILFAYFTPPNQQRVPADQHLDALLKAIDPYVNIKDSPEDRLPEVRKLLTILPEASLKDIADACRDGDYTHVHLLAHGAKFMEAGSERSGVALRPQQGDVMDVVDGERLAIALRGAGLNGALKPPPTLVSLATCDSGQVSDVVAPGGSIAHALHEAGIPWVVASQFPLWMKASTVAVECLYSRLLQGADPRLVLYELRQRLRTEVPETHDWASIVAYAVSPWDFDEQIRKFHDKQVRNRLDVLFDRMDNLVARWVETTQSPLDLGVHPLADSIRTEHAAWLTRTEADRAKCPVEYSEALGMKGASEKRIGIIYARISKYEQNKNQKKEAHRANKASHEAYTASKMAYQQALSIPSTNKWHWVITQFLSISALPALVDSDGEIDRLVRDFGDYWHTARQIAEWQLLNAEESERAWALGTLIELELLGSIYLGDDFNKRAAHKNIVRYCKELIEIDVPKNFAVKSTCRQMQRYVEDWHRDCWSELAKAGMNALGG